VAVVFLLPVIPQIAGISFPLIGKRLIADVIFLGAIATTVTIPLWRWARKRFKRVNPEIGLAFVPLVATIMALNPHQHFTAAALSGAGLIISATIIRSLRQPAQAGAPLDSPPNASFKPLQLSPIPEGIAPSKPELLPKKIDTLILKGGGAKGLAFAGVVDVLEQCGYTFKTFVGTSAGAVGAVLLAAGYKAEELLDLLAKKEFADFKDAGFLRSIWNLFWSGGLYEGVTLRTWILESIRRKAPFNSEKVFPELHMKDLKKAVPPSDAIVFASHPVIGPLVFDSDDDNRDHPIDDAVRLSASIPLFFVPGMYGGDRIYDGGLLNNFPVEVYQRVRMRGSAGIPDDFLAVYLGSLGDDGVRRFWFSEVWRILLQRDDRIILQKHEHRSIVVNTKPIETRHFRQSAEEKEWLVQQGRLSALTFIKDQFCTAGATSAFSESVAKALEYVQGRIDFLRLRVESLRDERGRSGWSFTLLVAAVCAVLFWGLYSWRGVDQYRLLPLSDNPYLVEAYVSNDRIVTGLKDRIAGEIKQQWEHLPDSYTEGCSELRSVTQLVFFDLNQDRQSGSACKIVVYEGANDAQGTRAGDLLKMTAGSLEGVAQVKGFLFERHAQGWSNNKGVKWRQIPEATTAEAVKTPKAANHTADKLQEYDLTTHVRDGVRDGSLFRMVTLTTYPFAFAEGSDVAPWVMVGHRFLMGGGIATYGFIVEPEGAVNFPKEIYMRTTADRFQRLKTPQQWANSVTAWARLNNLVTFLERPEVEPEISSFEGWKRVERALKVTKEAFEGFQAGYSDKHFAFTVDSDESTQLQLQSPNLLVFLEKEQQSPLRKKENEK
jgi:predicted acylesterase/phospholipase RssA